MIFLEDDRPSPIIVNHVTAAGGGWNWAAEELLASLQRHGVQQGQLISLDAHNLSPTDPAMFSAQYSSSLPGYGPLRLQCLGKDGACLNTFCFRPLVLRRLCKESKLSQSKS